jgi:hypothetical protein
MILIFFSSLFYETKIDSIILELNGTYTKCKKKIAHLQKTQKTFFGG